MYCSPIKTVKQEKTCYSKDDLLFLASSFNKKRKDEKKILLNQSKKKLWEELNNKLKKECEYEWCWLEKDFIPSPYSRKMLQETFRPKKPKEWNKNPYEWLTTEDIKKVMKQYEKRYPSFLFIGPVPLDCPTSITCPLSNFNVKLLIEVLGKTKLGVVYNLDPHNKPGSHWVALYSDFRKKTIFYFDSVGLPPPQPILSFINKLQNSIQEYYKIVFNINVNVNVLTNKTKFQYGSSECGVFSMYFIISNLTGKGIKKEETNDKKMNQMRNFLYRPND
jgi:hypothetical protein